MDEEFRNKINAVKQALVMALPDGVSAATLVPACMEIVMSSILHGADEDRETALRCTASLHPMVDYIESQIRGVQ